MGFLCFTFFIVLGSLSSPWADADGVHARGITPKLPKADNVTPQCTWWYDYGVEGPYQDMLEDSDISLQQFQQWNGVSGEERIVGRAYCVEAPTDAKPATTPSKPVSSGPWPSRPGTIGTCDRHHLAIAGESCWSIAQKNGIDLNDFFTWNPIVGRDCSGLWAGYHFCIGVSGPSQFQVKALFHVDCTGQVLKEAGIGANGANSDGLCLDTDCKVGSLEVAAAGSCPSGQVQISYWENPGCSGKWYGYGYTSRGVCRRLWTDGWKFKAVHIRCAPPQDDCTSKNTCSYDAEPDHGVC